jgi:hypothetical protein
VCACVCVCVCVCAGPTRAMLTSVKALCRPAGLDNTATPPSLVSVCVCVLVGGGVNQGGLVGRPAHTQESCAHVSTFLRTHVRTYLGSRRLL